MFADIIPKRVVKKVPVKINSKRKKVVIKTIKKAPSIRKKPTASIKTIIEAYLINRKDFYPFKARIDRNKLLGFHPSGLFNACPRKIAFQYLWEQGKGDYNKCAYSKKTVLNYLPDLTITHNSSPKLQLIFDIGHSIHFLIQYGYLPDYGIEHKVEVPITTLIKKYLIGGTGDIVIRLQDNKLYFVDIKTMRNELFYKVRSINDISENYIIQMMLYLFGLNMKQGIFLLVNKNDSSVNEFHLTFDKKVIEPVLKIASQGKEFLQGKSIPPILLECKKHKKRFKECAFSSVCFACTKQEDLLKLTKRKYYKDLILK